MAIKRKRAGRPIDPAGRRDHHDDRWDEALAEIEAGDGRAEVVTGTGWMYGDPETDYEFLIEVSYEGAVLATREKNGYHDSDFYAIVWTGSSVTSITYATTRFASNGNSAVVDATDEVKAEVADYLAPRLATRMADRANAKAERKATRIEKGVEVEVVKGRKVPIGATGVVFWTGPSKFDGSLRVGFETDAGDSYFTAASNVERTHVPPVTEADAAEFEERATKFATEDPVGAWLALRGPVPGYAVVR